MQPEAQLWWRQAQADLKTAADNIQTENYYACVFFVHQAVEKSLKATIIESKRILPPRTHSLLELGQELEVPAEFLTFFRELTLDYVTTRDPDAANGVPADLYDQVIAQRLLDQARKVIIWLESVITS
ncbi:MAG: HEPN domain-containing protein [Candidatus Heimdallarchaeota archaeon]